MAGSDEQDFEGQSTGSVDARDRDAPNISVGPSSPGIIEGAPNVTGASSVTADEDVLGSEAGLAAAQAAASAAESSTQMGDDPNFSGSNAIIDVDTFANIQKAQEDAARRQAQTDAIQGFDSVTGNPAISTGLQVDNFSSINAAIARTAAMNASADPENGSVNLAPLGINVGYQSNIGKVDTFDELSESTKAAVEAAHIQSQSEDETENAIAQMVSAFQSILSKAGKNTTNRQQDSGPDQ